MSQKHVARTVLLYVILCLSLLGFYLVSFQSVLNNGRIRGASQPPVKDRDVDRSSYGKSGDCEKAATELMGNETRGFKFHSDNLMKLRQNLTEHFKADIRQMSVLNQLNTDVDDSVNVFLTPVNITKSFRNILPKMSPFEDRMFETCSVVGSSDILTNRDCGRQIDKSDFVFRMNSAPYGEKYKKDVGSFANLTTLNGMLLNQRRWPCERRRGETPARPSRLEPLSENNTIHDVLLVRLPSTSRNSLLNGALRWGCQPKTERGQRLLFGNPRLVLQGNRFWRAFGFTGNMSSGLYVLTLALSMCRETHLYGFWPCRFQAGRPLRYHYYDDLEPKGAHNFNLESSILSHLSELGMIRIHLEHCR